MASKTENFYKNDKVAWEVSKPGYLSESGEITLLKDEVINVELFKNTDWVWTNFPSEINYKYLTFADGYMPDYDPGVEDIAVVTPFSVRGTRHKLIGINMHSDRPPVTPIEKNYPPILSTPGVTKMRVYSDFLETFDIYREMSRGGKLYHPGGTLEQIILSHTPNLTTFSVGNSGKLKELYADDFSHVTSMRKAFMQNLALTYISPMYLDSCEDLSQMFVRCEFKEFPTTLYNTSKVKSTYGMLEECTNLTSIPLFDTQNVTDMQRMFYNCTSLISVPEFNTRNVTDMSHMLDGCGKLKSVPLFDTSKVADISYMFNGCTSLTTVPLFDMQNVTNMASMFNGCTSLTSVPEFNTSNVTNMASMFNGCTSLTSVPLFDTSKDTNTESMFEGCASLTSVPSFDISNVTNMYRMFKGCTSLISVPAINIHPNAGMDEMFSGCTNLTTISAINTTSSVSSTYEMFKDCTSLTTVPLFDTQNVTNMGGMFWRCNSLTSVPLFDTQNVKDMYGMFYNCTSLTTIPLFNTQNVTNMFGPFFNCTSLTTIPLFDTQNVKDTTQMFYNCTSLKNVGGFIGLKVDISLSDSPLTHDSALNVIDNLAVSTGHIVKFKKTTFDTLTPEDIAKATSKGWEIRSVA